MKASCPFLVICKMKLDLRYEIESIELPAGQSMIL